MESSTPSDCEVQAVIKFLNPEGVARLEIRRGLSIVYGAGNISLCYLYEWIHFNAGWSDPHDEQWTDRPWDSINDETITCVRSLLGEDHRFTISDIHWEMMERYLTQTSRTTIFPIVTEELEILKVSAQWVLHMPTEDNRLNHMGRIKNADAV